MRNDKYFIDKNLDGTILLTGYTFPDFMAGLTDMVNQGYTVEDPYLHAYKVGYQYRCQMIPTGEVSDTLMLKDITDELIDSWEKKDYLEFKEFANKYGVNGRTNVQLRNNLIKARNTALKIEE